MHHLGVLPASLHAPEQAPAPYRALQGPAKALGTVQGSIQLNASIRSVVYNLTKHLEL